MYGSMSIRGAVSGFEVDEIIEQLMELERQPIERMEQRGQQALEKQEVWREVDSRARELQNSLTPMRERWNFLQQQAITSDDDVITAVAQDRADEAVYDFEVHNLATRHSIATSEGYIDSETALGYEGEIYLGTGPDITELDEFELDSETASWLHGSPELGFHAHLEAGQDYDLNIEELAFDELETGGEVDEVRISAASFTDAGGEDIMEELEQYYADKGKEDFDPQAPLLTLTYDGEGWQAEDQWGEEFTLEGDHPDGILNLEAEMVQTGEGEEEDDEILATRAFDFRFGSEAINQRRVVISGGDSLDDIAAGINGTTEETGVQASVIKKASDDYRLILTSQEEGTDGKIQAWSPEGLWEEMQIDKELTAPQDASFDFNGMEITRTSNTVDDLVRGVEFHLEGEGEATVEVEFDTDAPREMINNFIETYNSFNSILRQVQEEEDDGFQEDEDGVQRRGALRGDTTLMRIESRLRRTVFGLVPNIEGEDPLPANSLMGIGISAGAPSSEETDYMESAEGFLSITDDEALEEALRDDPEGVFELLGRRAPTDEDGNPRGPDGLARQVDDFLDSLVGPNGMVSNRQDQMQRQVSDLEDRIERLEARVQTRKDHLIRQFTAMERHISRMHGQGDFMDSFAGLREQRE